MSAISRISGYAGRGVDFVSGSQGKLWGLFKLALFLASIFLLFRLVSWAKGFLDGSLSNEKFLSQVEKDKMHVKVKAQNNLVWASGKATNFLTLNTDGIVDSLWLTTSEITDWLQDIPTYADYLNVLLAFGTEKMGLYQLY